MQLFCSSTQRLVAGAAVAVAALGIAGTSAANADSVPPAASTSHHPAPGCSASQLASAWIAAWRGSDPHQLAALFTGDAVYTDRGVDKSSYGPGGIAAWQANTHKLIPNVHGTLVDTFRSGGQMLIETIYSGQINGAPHPFAVHMATVLRLRGSKIVTDTDYYNLADLLRQSGLPPTWTPPKS